jgi:hypothetical protein
MRKLRTLAVLVCVISLAGLVMLAGCGEQDETPIEATSPDMQTPESDSPAPAGEEEPIDDTADEATGEDVEMLADVIKKWPESFVMTATVEDKETGETTVSTVAMRMGDEKPLKIKAEVAEGAAIMDYENEVMYSWVSGTGTAMKMDLKPMGDSAANPYTDVDPSAEITGSETIDGVECWVVETTGDEGETATTWLAKDNGLMQRVESGEVVMTYDYEQIGEVPDSEFEVPEGMQIEEMPDMEDMPNMENMPEMPENMPGG